MNPAAVLYCSMESAHIAVARNVQQQGSISAAPTNCSVPVLMFKGMWLELNKTKKVLRYGTQFVVVTCKMASASVGYSRY